MATNPCSYRYFLPEETLGLRDWSDAHRVLTTRSAAEAGPYRSARTPYLRAIMDDLSVESPVQRVVMKKCAQIGASELGNCWIGYLIDQAPGPVLLVQPTVELAKRYSKQRIDTLFDESDRLRAMVRPARSRDSGNTMLLKEFAGGVLVITGANSAVGLRSMPVRFLFLDEIDAYPGDVESEGDPVSLAEARARTFSFRAKKLLISTPLIKGASRISREYERSDQRKYFVPCPLCADMQVLEFPRLRWQPGKPSTVLYQCKACEGTFAEHHKTDMLAAGEWRATAATPADPLTHGYHINGLYSPVGWLSWTDIAKQWEVAATDADARKTFINTVLGEEWEEEAAEVPDWQRLYQRREAWPHHTVPERGLFLTAGADVQLDRIEIDVWAWGRGLESWLIEHIVITGDPGRVEIWDLMSLLLTRTWEHSTGARMALQHLAIDTGFATQSVYQWARSQDRGTVLPVRGVGTYDRIVPVAGPTKVEVKQDGKRLKRGLGLWTVSVSFFKKELYKQLGVEPPTDEQIAQGFTYPTGYVHLPDTTSDEWVKQLVAEQQVIVRSRHGFHARTEWRQLRPRNEALDARVYARAAVWLAGCDRWGDNRWRSLETQLGITEPPPHKPPPPPAPTNRPGGPVTSQQATTPTTPTNGDATMSAESTLPAEPSAGRIRGGIRTMTGPRRRRVAYWQGGG
jgi:phage terminase large subunit GpA-like protein